MNFASKIDASFIKTYQDQQVPWGPLGYVTYKRTYARPISDRTEEWWETCQRKVNGLLEHGLAVSQAEAQLIYHYFFNLKMTTAGRGIWQLGTDNINRIGADSLQNCWHVTCHRLKAFLFAFNQLMLGGGVGFSVQAEHIYKLPPVKFSPKIERVDSWDCDFIVTDNREGWVELLNQVFISFFETGKDFTYCTNAVRGRGTPIKGFGGTASGPEILVLGISQIMAILQEHHHRQLGDVACLDIFNIIGSIVVAGNIRRSAEIAIGDCHSVDFLNAKQWDKVKVPNWRAMSNNTVQCSDFSRLNEQFWSNYNGDGEAVGICNLRLAREMGRLIDGPDYRLDRLVKGTNPCQPAHATVLTRDGIRTFADIDVGSVIWSGKRWTKVVKKVATGVKKVKEYQTRAGIFIGTEEHRVVQRGEKIEVRFADSIDRSCGNSIVEDPTHRPAWVMDGLVIGDGTTHKASNLTLLCIGQDDSDYFTSEVADLILKERPGIKPGHYEICTFYDDLPRTFDREVPQAYFTGHRDMVRSFLRGLYSANGSVVDNRVTLKASSFKLIDQVQQMLSGLGIRSYYTVNKAHNVTFNNGEYLCKESYDLNILGDRDEFVRQIGFLQTYKMEKLREVRYTGMKTSYGITSVKDLGEMEVFDITVEAEEHTYWTGGMLVSNCGEIFLEDTESCNLLEIYLPNVNRSEFFTAATLAVKIGKTISLIPCSDPDTQAVVDRNHRLGIGVTGFQQALHHKDEKLFNDVYHAIEAEDVSYSRLVGCGLSVKLTTVKPSGTLSTVAGCTSGMHPAKGRHYIRRIRMNSEDALVEQCRRHGYYVEPVLNLDGTRDLSTMVVEFPVKTPAGTVIEDEMTAIDQLESQRWLQTYWADNSVSCTVVYDPEELPEVKTWLKENYDTQVKSTSFLRRDGGGFKQMPYEEIAEWEYNDMVKRCKPITDVQGTGTVEGLTCEGGACPAR